jgi:RDD family
MQSKPLNFLYTIGQRNQWLVAVVTTLLLIIKILGQLPYSNDGTGYLDFAKIPEMLDRVIQFAVFGQHDHSYVDFYGQLAFGLIVLTWILLIVGVIRYYGEKRSVTILKLVLVFILWQGLFDLLRLPWFACVNPFESAIIDSYFSIPLIVWKMIMPILLSVFILGLLSSTRDYTTVVSEESITLNRWQRGFHYFLDRMVIWFCGYNFYLMMAFSTEKDAYLFIGSALFLSQLIVLPVILEWLFGVTLAKLITGSEVVRTNGKPITLTQALARGFIRVIPFGWLSVFGKNPWIDQWTGTEVRYVNKDEPLLRLHKCVQLITGFLFFFGSWSLLSTLSFALGIDQLYKFNESRFFSFFILFISLFFVPFLQSFWLAAVVSYYRAKRDGKSQHSNEVLLQAFYCWIPIRNFYYPGAYLEEMTSHMEHLGVSEEDNERIASKIRQFSNVFGLAYLFISGLFIVLFISTSSKNTLFVTGLIFLTVMTYAFFAWNFSRTLKNTVIKSAAVSDLIDDLGN